MVCTWLSCLPLRRIARKQNQASMLVLSKYDSQTSFASSEAEEMPASRESQQIEPPSLTTLPTELVLLISEQLPLADALCLALTCNRMYNIANIGNLATRLDTDAKDTLLCRLERDNAELSYCFKDQKLLTAAFHQCSPDWLYAHLHKTTDLQRVPSLSLGLFHLDYCTARVVTNHQLLSSRHGVPASYLAETRNYRPPWARGVCRNQIWAANVIHGELFLSCIHTIFHKAANTGALQHYCNTEIVQVCPHTWFGSQRGFRLPRNAIGNTKCHYSGWCWKCETDWEVDLGWADTKRGWTVTITSYHGLGACRSPLDHKWQAMSCNRKAKAHREVPGGAVKDLWEQHKS